MSSQEDKDKKKKQLLLQAKYAQRITIARVGREAFLAKDYVTAAAKYTEYLSILAELNDLNDIFALKPTMFDPNKDVTEMLLISHVFWEMARINEMTPKLQEAYKKYLSQFIKFTINQPYQVFNSEMMRKYIKKNKGRSIHTGMLNEAYSQIFVQSKKCFIATFCFDEGSIELSRLRAIKPHLEKTKYGLEFIKLYYRLSSPFVDFLEKHKKLRTLSVMLLKPILKQLSKLSITRNS